jgi:hypothetical protein
MIRVAVDFLVRRRQDYDLSDSSSNETTSMSLIQRPEFRTKPVLTAVHLIVW